MDPKNINFAALLPDKTRLNPAQWAHERIVKSIKEFESHLNEEQEVGARLVSFANSEVFHIKDVGYWGPDIIKFYGQNMEGQPVELLQHISQLNVLLVAVKKQHEKPRRFGFGAKLEDQMEE